MADSNGQATCTHIWTMNAQLTLWLHTGCCAACSLVMTGKKPELQCHVLRLSLAPKAPSML